MRAAGGAGCALVRRPAVIEIGAAGGPPQTTILNAALRRPPPEHPNRNQKSAEPCGAGASAYRVEHVATSCLPTDRPSMPELPDITIYVEAIAERVVGTPFVGYAMRSPFFLRTVDPPLDSLVGRRVVTVSRLGKRIVIELEGEHYLVIHLMIARRRESLCALFLASHHLRPQAAGAASRRSISRRGR